MNIFDAVAFGYIVYMLILPVWWLGIHSRIREIRRLGWAYYMLPVLLFFLITFFIFYNYSTVSQYRINTFYTFFAGIILAGITMMIDLYRGTNYSFSTLIGLPEFFPRKYKSKLITSGIFSYIRHPRYLEYMLFALGMAFLTGLIICYLLFFYVLIAFNIIARYEEKELIQRFGKKYIAYMKRVPRFLPKIN